MWLSVCAYWTYIQNVFLILNFICSEINYVLFTMKLFQLKLCPKLWTDCTVLHWPKYIPNSCLLFQWPKLSHSTNIWTWKKNGSSSTVVCIELLDFFWQYLFYANACHWDFPSTKVIIVHISYSTSAQLALLMYLLQCLEYTWIF